MTTFIFFLIYEMTREDVMIWTRFPRYCPFVKRIHRSPVNSPQNNQQRGQQTVEQKTNSRVVGALTRHDDHMTLHDLTKTL